MRVLLLSDWRSNRGGAESYILSIRDSLREQGDEVLLLSCGSGTDNREAGDMRAIGSDAPFVQSFLQIVNPFAVAQVKKALRTFRPDVALVSQFAYHLSPAVFRALSTVPTVVTIMDYKSICPLGTKLLPDGSICRVARGVACRNNGCVSALHWMRDEPRYALMRTGLRTARRVLCQSESMRVELAASGIDALSIPLGVREPAPHFRREPAGMPTFVYCGRLSREKGVAVLIAAFAKLNYEVPAARLRIVGEGPLRRELQQLTVLLGVADRVDFRGWVDSGEMDSELFDAWAVVAPSLWAEPFGLVALEAIVRGIPVVASDSGGFREIVESGVNGLLFPNGNALALMQSLRSIARREAFPDLRLSADVIDRTRRDCGIRHHTARMRDVLRDTAFAVRGSSVI